MKQLAEIFAVISTLMDSSDEFYQKTLMKLINWLIKCESNGAVLAMVSEVLSFSASERRKQWHKSLEYLSASISLLVSVSVESAAIAVDPAKNAQKDGVNAAMATPPSAFVASADEIKITTDELLNREILR